MVVLKIVNNDNFSLASTYLCILQPLHIVFDFAHKPFNQLFMSPRPSNPTKITLDDLQPGDLLLSGGSDLIDRIINIVDKGIYSHTTFYCGKINGQHMVVEATEQGIMYHTPDSDMEIQNLVDAYRYVSPDGHRFGDPGWDVQPVLDQAMSYVGAKYAYSELVLGALVIIAAEVPKEESVSELVRISLNLLEHELELWLNAHADKTPMTCVQVATSAYWQAVSTPPNKYGLQVVIDDSRQTTGSSAEMKEYLALRNRLKQKLDSKWPGWVYQSRKESGGLTLFAGSEMLPLGSCTPRDLEYSPTLEYVGCLKDTRNNP